MIDRMTRGIVLALACTVAACGDSAHGPAAPTPAVVDVYVSVPNAEDRALLLTVGRAIEFTPADGIQRFQNATGTSTALLLVSAASLPVGETRVGSFNVTDINHIAATPFSIQEVARADYRLRENLVGYSVRLARR